MPKQWFVWLGVTAALVMPAGVAAQPRAIDERISFAGPLERAVELSAGQTIEIALGIASPSKLPDNGRLAVEWSGPAAEEGFRKVLHALDPDVYVVYRAPQAGKYTLTLRAAEDEYPPARSQRWRETGVLADVKPFPRQTPWPAGHQVEMRVLVRAVEFGPATRGHIVETEPNNAPAQAQPLPLAAQDCDQTLHLTGGVDDIEYFDNGQYGESGDDWFRLEYPGQSPRLLSVNLMPSDPMVAARVRVYTPDGQEYTDGKHLNETAHEQAEEHRTAVVRTLQPGGAYLLRVEANSPGYDLEVRIRRPAPLTDPREAVRLAMYDHVAQVSAWLMNRPRGNSLDRRLRDTGSLYGSNCMSCHTQSGVWGPAGPLAFGYRIENPLHYRHLVNVMYESLRPTSVLKDAANNTSLPPHDLGDGPAGTRIAGHNVLTLETVAAPRKLHSMQQIRTANYVLQTSDPSGINAAGKGSNVGRAVVIHYAAEILRRAWDKTGDARYLAGIEERATKMLDVEPQFTDDLAHRVMFFRRVFPAEYATLKGNSPEAQKLAARIQEQLQRDEQAIRSSQREDGAWGFSPGQVDRTADPSPTALAIDALVALGAGADDPAVARGVKALLAMQHPYGLWNRSARTGFVTTSYVMHALSRLYPDERPKLTRKDVEPAAGESLYDTIARMRLLAQIDTWSAAATEGPPDEYLDLMLAGASHQSALVRFWAMTALGARHTSAAVPELLRGLNDPVKMVREAARWGLRQTLLDDEGWDQVFDAYEQESDLAREQIAAALVMRADAVMPASQVNFERLAETLDRMMNRDESPAVRAWAARAAWNWWVWNPPTRGRLNQAYLTMIQTPEPSQLAENAKRYQLQALLIVNGNRSSANYDNPYPELAEFFATIGPLLDSDAADLVSRRLTHVAGTYYNASYGSNGTGQLGYATPGASPVIGRAISRFWQQAEAAGDSRAVQLSVEAAANVIHEGVQNKLLDYSIKGPEALRPIAASSLSDPRAVTFPTTPEFVGPLIERIHANAQTEEGRRQISRTTVRQLSQARWDMPTSEGRQREFFNLLIPKLDDPSSESQWFLAEQLGRIVAANPDFHTPTLLAMMPKTFNSPLEETFWLPSAGWMLTYGAAVPEIGQAPAADTTSELHRFALALVTRNLDAGADRRARAVAVSMLYQPALYSSPEVIAAAGRVDAGNFRRLLPEAFDRDLREAVSEDSTEPKLELTERRRRNFAYFRDYVVPELARTNRGDGESCFSCHGGGKIPSMSLEAPDRRSRYLSPQDTWTNYRTLLGRIDKRDAAGSKVLRKPLNIQTGKEDGHQGGPALQAGGSRL
ncbi:MAG: HEAT repeat domain-containing protein [Planctomycetaceae bacterium]|nr:HEAT repeat domain-containing protein [Planctomycetaceae bacterium]